MKRILFVFILLACSFSAMAATEGRATFVLTNAPANNDTLTYRGVTKTWKTTVTSSSTQILIGGTAAISANNLAAHLAQYPFDTTSHLRQINTTNIIIIADPDLTVTASITGTWGTVAVTTSTLTQYGVALPFATERTATRTNNANDLILAFDYASAAFAANVAAFQNYMPVSVARTNSANNKWTGNNLFTGITTNLNASQRWDGGYITNLTSAYIATIWNSANAFFQGGLKITNETPVIEFADSDASANNKRTQLYGDQTAFLVKFLNDAGSSVSNVFEITKDSTFGASRAIFRTRLTADYIYDTKLTNSWLTNMIGIHSAWAQLAYTEHTGQVSITNAAPSLILWDTSAGADLKGYELAQDNGVLILRMGNDSADFTGGGTAQEVFRVSRVDETTTGASVTFQPQVYFNGGMSAVIGNIVATSGAFKTPQGIVLGSNSEDLPTDLIGLFLYDGAAPSGDPVDGVGVWSAAGNWLYRSSASSEGAGQVNHVHNRTATTQGAGTDYTLTGSTAAVDFGTTDPNFTAPTAGTYLIFADVGIQANATSAPDIFQAKIRNVTAGADITGNDQLITHIGGSEYGTLKMTCTATLAASDVVAIYAHNGTSARGTVNSARTRIGYVRLY